MKVRIKEFKDLTQEDKKRLFSRSEIDISDVMASVNDICDAVKDKGDTALRDFTKKFDKVDLDTIPLRVSEKEFDEADGKISDDLKEAINYSIKNVRSFHEMQRPEGMVMKEIKTGIIAGEKPVPVDSFGFYVPSGRGSFPSMLYMMAVPAEIAGVPRVCVVTPPMKDGSVDPAVLYTAKQCGINEVYRVGGAQAIAALAYGTESIPSVVKLTGPGSMYISAAKRILYNVVDVGLPAGPSDAALIADETADPWKVALDLMIEAEHGSDSSAILVTPSKELGDKVAALIEKEVETLPEPRKTFVTDVLTNYGGIILCNDINEAAEIVNEYAPEHLQIQTEEPFEILPLIRNASEILLGDKTPFSVANYSVGANAILPTGGRAKTYSAVSVRDFIKYVSIVYVTRKGYDDLKTPVTTLADYEGFVTHGNALKKR